MGFFGSLDRSARGKSGSHAWRSVSKLVGAPIKSALKADMLYRKVTTGKWGSPNQRIKEGTHELYSADPIGRRYVREKDAVKIVKVAGAVAGAYFAGAGLSSYYGASGSAAAEASAAASDAGTLYATAPAYSGAVFPVSGGASSAVLSSVPTTFSPINLLTTLGSTIKDAAGFITAAKIIVDAVGGRKVLPQGASLPPGYTVIGDYKGDGNLNPTNGDPSVSSDGVGFKLPSNSGFLLLALGALALVKG